MAAVSILTQCGLPPLHSVVLWCLLRDAVRSLRAGAVSPSPSITHRDHPRSLHAADAPCSLIDGGDEAREGRAGEGGQGRVRGGTALPPEV